MRLRFRKRDSHMEDEVTVTGKEYNKNGTEYLVVESVK